MTNAIPVANPRLLAQPAGARPDVATTADLRPGDIIYVEFPFFSKGSLKYGGSEAFTVLEVSDIGVVVSDESGDTLTLPAGTRADLEERLKAMTSVSRVVVVRPDGSAVEATPDSPVGYTVPAPLSDGEVGAIFTRASYFLIPGYDYVPLATRDPRDLEVADILYDDCGGQQRIYGIEAVDPDGTLHLVLIKSDDPRDIQGMVSRRPDMPFWACEMGIRVGRVDAPSGPFLAVAAVAALAVVVLAVT